MRDEEREALIWTFGGVVGNRLADIIDIQFEDLSQKNIGGYVPAGRTDTIVLKLDYNYNSVYDLAVFIHEATHIWQKQTGLHRDKGDGDYLYTSEQLRTLSLSNEEHAESVQDWFFATWGLSTGEILVKTAWSFINSAEIRQLRQNNNSAWYLLLTVEQIYAPVLNEIRNPSHYPRKTYTRSRLARHRGRR